MLHSQNSAYIQETNSGALPNLLKLSKYVKKTIVLPALKSSSLVSLGQLYDNDCCVLLNKQKSFVIKTVQ